MKVGQSSTKTMVRRIVQNCVTAIEYDSLATEEPLEIRVGFVANNRPTHKSVSITMRTPNRETAEDFELAVGFLFTENIITSAAQIAKVDYCGKPAKDSTFRNTVRVDLADGVEIDWQRLERHFYTSSSCGVCGKTSIAALEVGVCGLKNLEQPRFDAELIHRLPQILRRAQNTFDKTGGLHAAALFDSAGELRILREDVGRHNAVDKLIGAQLLKNQMPLDDYLLLVSGRASFELVQKALMANIPILAAVGAPSSLAVELAQNFGMTLLGFVRDDRFNIYSNPQRIGVIENQIAKSAVAGDAIARLKTVLTQ